MASDTQNSTATDNGPAAVKRAAEADARQTTQFAGAEAKQTKDADQVPIDAVAAAGSAEEAPRFDGAEQEPNNAVDAANIITAMSAGERSDAVKSFAIVRNWLEE